jgi:hypothetical protein
LLGFESTRNLHRISALLQPSDDAVAYRPDVRKTRLEGFARRFCSRRVFARGDDAVAASKNSDGSVCQSSKSENRRVKKSVTPASPK